MYNTLLPEKRSLGKLMADHRGGQWRAESRVTELEVQLSRLKDFHNDLQRRESELRLQKVDTEAKLIAERDHAARKRTL